MTKVVVSYLDKNKQKKSIKDSLVSFDKPSTKYVKTLLLVVGFYSTVPSTRTVPKTVS